jgi:hypothetical protein
VHVFREVYPSEVYPDGERSEPVRISGGATKALESMNFRAASPEILRALPQDELQRGLTGDPARFAAG